MADGWLLKLGPVALALVVWIIGVLAAWWLSRAVERSIGRGDGMERTGRLARHAAYYGLLLGLMVACLEIAGIPISLDRAMNLRIGRVGEEELLVSNIVFAAVLILTGLIISRWAARRTSSYLLSRRVDATAADAVQKLVFYILLIAVAVAALEELHVPMTSFAFLGGAVAIGVGFGAQNIINNFISGWILLAERPVRLKDMVEVEDHMGRVEHIGARCTRIRRTDGVDVLVPNSTLLENLVVNWTLTDDIIRATVRVGVAYGTPTDRVVDLLRRIVDEDRQVLPHPAPEVVFEDFGDNALIFDIYFWTHASGPLALREVASDLRLKIDAAFRETGIVIAFPQRDVHLDSPRPLDIRVMRAPREVAR